MSLLISAEFISRVAEQFVTDTVLYCGRSLMFIEPIDDQSALICGSEQKGNFARGCSRCVAHDRVLSKLSGPGPTVCPESCVGVTVDCAINRFNRPRANRNGSLGQAVSPQPALPAH